MIRFIFEKAYSELKKAHGAGKVVKWLVWFVRILLWIFELFVKYVIKQAYIQTALYGTHFIKSAINAFVLLSRNIAQIGILHTLTTVVLFVSKLCIAFATAFAAYALAAYGGPYLLFSNQSQSYAPLIITIISFFIGYFISALFINILDTAIDTILQCFLIDDEMAASDPNYKPHCTNSLSMFISDHKTIDKLEKFVCQCCCCLTGCQCCKKQEQGTPNYENYDATSSKTPEATI